MAADSRLRFSIADIPDFIVSISLLILAAFDPSYPPSKPLEKLATLVFKSLKKCEPSLTIASTSLFNWLYNKPCVSLNTAVCRSGSLISAASAVF